MRIALFWVIRQQVVLISYRRFETFQCPHFSLYKQRIWTNRLSFRFLKPEDGNGRLFETQEITITRCAISQKSAVIIITKSSSYIRVRQLHTTINRNYLQSRVFTSCYTQRRYNLTRPDYIGVGYIIIIVMYYKHVL